MLDRLLWRLWGWPIGLVMLVLGLLIWPAGCANPIADRIAGPAETPAQRAYRAAVVYGVVTDLACEYVSTPTAVPGASARLAQAADVAYRGLVRARAGVAFGGAGGAVAGLGGVVEGLAAQVTAVVSHGPTAPGTVGYAVDRALQVASGYAHLRLQLSARRSVLDIMAAEGRDPLPGEWHDVMGLAQEAHACLVAGETGP
jgi:hypothetical protein